MFEEEIEVLRTELAAGVDFVPPSLTDEEVKRVKALVHEINAVTDERERLYLIGCLALGHARSVKALREMGYIVRLISVNTAKERYEELVR